MTAGGVRRCLRSLFPTSRAEWWLSGIAVAGWLGTGAAGLAGVLAWPEATLLSGVAAAPLLVWSTFFEDDDDR